MDSFCAWNCDALNTSIRVINGASRSDRNHWIVLIYLNTFNYFQQQFFLWKNTSAPSATMEKWDTFCTRNNFSLRRPKAITVPVIGVRRWIQSELLCFMFIFNFYHWKVIADIDSLRFRCYNGSRQFHFEWCINWLSSLMCITSRR